MIPTTFERESLKKKKNGQEYVIVYSDPEDSLPVIHSVRNIDGDGKPESLRSVPFSSMDLYMEVMEC